jgi:hypothetical protein
LFESVKIISVIRSIQPDLRKVEFCSYEKNLLLPLLTIILASCGNASPTTTQIINELILTSTSHPTPLMKTASPANRVNQYTLELNDRIQSCIEFRDIYDFTAEGELIDYKLGLNKIRKCIDNVQAVQVPDECEGCDDLVQLIDRFSNQTLESMRLIEEGHELDKEVYISEGLVTFWDTDLLWELIRLTIDKFRAEYNLPEIN